MDLLPTRWPQQTYYNLRPSALPVGLMPRTSYALGSAGCYQRETSNNQSKQGANLLGKSCSLVASNPGVGKETQSDMTTVYGTFFVFRVGRVRASALDQEDGSWARHQLRVKQITNNENRQTERDRDQEKGPAQVGPYVHAPVGVHERLRDPAQPVYEARLADDSVDEEPQPNSPVRQRFHAIPIARGERMSRRDRYDGLDRANPGFFAQPAREYAPMEPADRVMPNIPVPMARLAKMDVFKGEGNDQLDTFFDQVEEFAAFFTLG